MRMLRPSRDVEVTSRVMSAPLPALRSTVRETRPAASSTAEVSSTMMLSARPSPSMSDRVSMRRPLPDVVTTVFVMSSPFGALVIVVSVIEPVLTMVVVTVSAACAPPRLLLVTVRLPVTASIVVTSCDSSTPPTVVSETVCVVTLPLSVVTSVRTRSQTPSPSRSIRCSRFWPSAVRRVNDALTRTPALPAVTDSVVSVPPPARRVVVLTVVRSTVPSPFSSVSTRRERPSPLVHSTVRAIRVTASPAKRSRVRVRSRRCCASSGPSTVTSRVMRSTPWPVGSMATVLSRPSAVVISTRTLSSEPSRCNWYSVTVRVPAASDTRVSCSS